MFRSNSFIVRNALTYLILYLFSIGLISIFLLTYSSKEILSAANKKLEHTHELIDLQFSKYLDEIKEDIDHLTHSPLINYYLNNPNKEFRQYLSQDYLSIINSKINYAQIRFIDNKGNEIVRVDRNSNGTFIVAEEQLQNKSDREYFQQALQYNDEEIYISNIDLNKEFGQISYPLTPTLRLASPLVKNGETQGIIVINVLLTVLFDNLKSTAGEGTNISIINSDGFYVLHSDSTKTFEFEFDGESSYLNEYEIVPSELVLSFSDVFKDQDKIALIRPYYLAQNALTLYILLSSDSSSILNSYFQWRNKSFVVIASLTLLFLLLALFILRNQANALTDITQKIIQFKEGKSLSELPIQRKDEIGELSRQFSKMAGVVQNNFVLLQTEKTRAENAVKDKEEFIENMSHEIRNPLQSILGLTELLSSNNPANHQIELLNSLRLNTQNLTSLVNDILDYKILLRKEINIKKSWFDLNEFIDGLVRSHSYHASLSKIKIEKHVDVGLQNKEVFMDIDRLSQIINNLVINAIKYSDPDDRIDIFIKKKSNNLIEFKIVDTGEGISQDLIEAIRQRYYSQNVEGQFSKSFGLGLTIITELLACFDSQLKIESQKGEGSVFYFDLQIDTRDAQIQDHSQRLTDEGPHIKNIIVIDDDKEILNLINHIFSNTATEVHSFPHPTAVDLTDPTLSDIQIIIVDNRFQDIRLIDFLNTPAGEEFHTKNLILISGTQVNPDDYVSKCRGFQFLQKPFTRATLFNAIKSLTQDQKSQQVDISSIIKDYDYDNDKIYNALSILSSEFKLMSKGLYTAILEEDMHGISEIRHKMVTTLRRLNLGSFEAKLNSIEDSIEMAETKEIAESVKNQIDLYLAELKILISNYSK